MKTVARRLSLWCATFAAAGSVAAMPRPSEYIPDEIPLPVRERPLLKADAVEITIPGIGLYPAGKQLKRTSLEGKWKFSGLESSELPFPDDAGAEIRFAAPDFDDSAWKEISVPTNWWTVPEYSYDKIFRKSTKTVMKGQAYTHRYQNPYCKGWYRQTITLPDPLPGRVQLEFHAVGYSAELFVNGKSAGRHHGDFSTWTADITAYAKPGKNQLALRILADLGPHDSQVKHSYGACWSNDNIKGGLWDHVFLREDASRYQIDRAQLSADSKGNFRLNYRIVNEGDQPLSLTPGLAVTPAEEGLPPATAKEYPAITLKKGENTGTVEFHCDNPKLWTPDTPNLYFATLYFRNGDRIEAVRIERFGFRDFTVRGTDFLLNGKPIFLRLDTVQSMMFSGDRGNPYERVTGFKKKGLNILRTAHQPVTPRVYDVADEVGMMIYDEWALAFHSNLHPDFLRTNRQELEEFILRDHNRPCVVMWLLGNEVNHPEDSPIQRVLADQVAQVRQLDLQKRPIAAFAGNGNVRSYGTAPLDTDIVDFHIYTGITRPWSQWDYEFQYMYKQAAAVYGKNGVIDKPVVISEAIGGGWGLHSSGDPGFRRNDVDAYLDRINRAFSWGLPGAAGYSGAIGVKAALDPARNWRYTQNLNGTRIIEMARQDPRIAGFGTWIGETGTRQYPRWFQPVYAGLRISPAHRLPLHQLLTPGKLTLDAFLINQGNRDLADASVKLELCDGGKTNDLGTVRFGAAAAGARLHLPVVLNLPETTAAEGELRLTVFDGKTECGRNSYELTLHRLADAAAPVENARPGLLLASCPAVERILHDLRIPYVLRSPETNPEKFSWMLLPPGARLSEQDAAALRRHLENGALLVSLEQPCGKLPIVPEYQVTSDYNTMVEPVVETHPLFRNLGDADFDVWGENSDGNVITRTLLPLNPTTLAVKGRFFIEQNAGSGVVEAKVGKGRLVASQLDAVALWKCNGAATRFLRNLFAYAAGGGEWYAGVRELERKAIPNYAIAHERIQPVDLSRQANRSFQNLGSGAKDDFPAIPSGRREAGGIPFEILDPARNGGRSCTALKGAATPDCPAAVTGIPVNCKMNKLFFLHTALNAEKPGRYAVYRMHYEDGLQIDFAMSGGTNVGDWKQPAPLPEALPGLVGQNAAGNRFGLFVTQWENPQPEKKIVSIDFLADKQHPETSPVLVAVTGETLHPEPLMLLPPAAKGPGWGCCADNGGEAGSWEAVKTGNPRIGEFANRLRFPASRHAGFAAAILACRVDRKRFADNNYDYLSFWFRSNDNGVIDLTFPQKEHAARRVYNLDLGRSKGKWVRVRLNLERDFKLEGEPFEAYDWRTELILYNGYDKTAGFPRAAATVDFADFRLE